MQRARAEEAVAYSEQKYRSLFTSLHEGYAVVEVLADERGRWADFRFLETNPAFEPYTGLRQAVGRRASEILGRPDPEWASRFGRVAETGQPAQFELHQETPGRTFDTSAFQLGGEGSRRLAVVFADITERKQAEEALRRNEQRQQKALFSSTVGVIFFNMDGNIHDANEAFQRMSGYPHERRRQQNQQTIRRPQPV